MRVGSHGKQTMQCGTMYRELNKQLFANTIACANLLVNIVYTAVSIRCVLSIVC